MDDPFGLVGTRIDGKFDVEHAVAEGGFGVVYRGLHLTLQKPVAIKVLKTPPELGAVARAAFMESFAREARTIARLEHSAIVKVLDFGISPMPCGVVVPWMALDWLTGQTLEADLEARRRAGLGGRSPAECMALLRPVFEALANAHDEGIAHRDIKPANLMLLHPTRDPLSDASARDTGRVRRGEPAIRLMDFGIAKVMKPDETCASGQTRTQAVLLAFSLPYAAPEQLSTTRTGPWTDVHALALVLTELLTGAAPYQAHDMMEMQIAILSPQRPTPLRFGVDVGAWEPVLAHALALRPAERFSNAGEFLAALEACMPMAFERAATQVGGPFPMVVEAQTFSAAALDPRGRTHATPAARLGSLVGVTLLGVLAATGVVVGMRHRAASAPVTRVRLEGGATSTGAVALHPPPGPPLPRQPVASTPAQPAPSAPTDLGVTAVHVDADAGAPAQSRVVTPDPSHTDRHQGPIAASRPWDRTPDEPPAVPSVVSTPPMPVPMPQTSERIPAE